MSLESIFEFHAPSPPGRGRTYNFATSTKKVSAPFHRSSFEMRCTMRWLVGGIRPTQRSTIFSSAIRWEWLTPKFSPTLELGERRSAVAVVRTGILPALLVLVMSICLSTSADARRWKWWHYYSSYERSARSGDDDRRRARASEVPPAARAGRGVAALGAIAERFISGCRQQSAELANLPFDAIARIAAPDDAQHAALDALRGTAREAAERFASDCPQSVPGPPCDLRRWSRPTMPPERHLT